MFLKYTDHYISILSVVEIGIPHEIELLTFDSFLMYTNFVLTTG